MGLWTFTSAVIRIYAAYNLENAAIRSPPPFVAVFGIAVKLCMITFACALFNFLGEIIVHKTAPVSSPGVWPALAVSSIGLVLMTLNYSVFVTAGGPVIP
ncbi:ergosterol biosynthesis protein [Rhizoclosmatium hyalinum]|nr:ergosterol biosynthesis protein [Rhizoclosmatium hyalinum]